MESVLVVLTVFASVTAVLLIYVISRNKERMALIEKGMSQSELKGALADTLSRKYALSSLKWGLLAAFVGIGLFVANGLHDVWFHDESVYFASMLLFGGIALVIFYFFASKKLNHES